MARILEPTSQGMLDAQLSAVQWQAVIAHAEATAETFPDRDAVALRHHISELEMLRVRATHYGQARI